MRAHTQNQDDCESKNGFFSKFSSDKDPADVAAEHVILGETEQDDQPCCQLDWKTRIIGFAVCYVLGSLLAFLSIINITSIVTNPSGFALLYSIGNVLAISGTCFLWGPKKQVTSMFETLDRTIASSLYIGCLIGTILLCIFFPKWYLVLPMVIVQMLAGLWYTLSFFPRIRRWLLGCCVRGICGKEIN